MKRLSMLTIAVAMQMTTVQAETIESDWLYISPTGTWLEQNQTLMSAETQLALPIENLTPELFWWQSEIANTKVSWQSALKGWPKQGDVVTSDQLTGEWVISQAQSAHVVLSQDAKRRIWPSSQLHLLEWSVDGESDNFELLVEQPSNNESMFQYAWRDSGLTAQVSYRLSLSEDPVLYQELIIANNTEYDVTADGYSFAMSASQPIMAREMTSLSRVDAAPQASQSQGIPTLIAQSPVTFEAHSNQWLPVSSTPLSSVERQYSLTWDSRMQGVQQANSTLKIGSSASLPKIPGLITLGVFDQQVPTINSQYQANSDHEAILNLGSSSLLTLDAKVVGENKWDLVVSNRTDEKANLQLTLSHWNGNTLDKTPLTVTIKANRSASLKIELSEEGKLVNQK